MLLSFYYVVQNDHRPATGLCFGPSSKKQHSKVDNKHTLEGATTVNTLCARKGNERWKGPHSPPSHGDTQNPDADDCRPLLLVQLCCHTTNCVPQSVHTAACFNNAHGWLNVNDGFRPCSRLYCPHRAWVGESGRSFDEVKNRHRLTTRNDEKKYKNKINKRNSKTCPGVKPNKTTAGVQEGEVSNSTPFYYKKQTKINCRASICGTRKHPKHCTTNTRTCQL